MLINLHQLKTGGKTLEGILYRNFKKELFYLTKSQKNTEKIYIGEMFNILKDQNYKKRIEKKNVITGHMLFGLHKVIKNIDTKYYTVLRDPYQRAKSYFYYMMQSEEFEITKILIKKKIDFEKFCNFCCFSKKKLKTYGFSNRAIEEIDIVLNNGQTRVISGNLKISKKKSYILAKQNIKKHFIAVGVIELYEKSIAILASKIKLKIPIYINKVNTSNSYNLNILNEKKIKQKFNRHNSYDLKLHKYYSLKIEKEINKRPLYYYFILQINKINSYLQFLLRPLIKKIVFK